MILPKLSAYQTLENSQGTLDPLGLYTIADRLAARLAPDLRERMKHPRYLTAIAVGSVICSSFDEDDLSVDEVSPPWQVYEWYVVSALVKKFEKEDPHQLLGMPGREKTTRAMREGVPLSASRYLKTPSVFGFHGVYRTLAKGIALLDDGQIGEFGAELVDIWEREQKLNGFRIGINGTTGNDFRKRMEDAVRLGCKTGAVAKPWSWEYYNQVAASLAPKNPGKDEANLIYSQLLKGEDASRSELIKFLLSAKGSDLLKTNSEKNIHAAFIETNPECKPVLLAIQAYESICRLLYNAFYEVLQWMEKHQGRASIKELSNLHFVNKAYRELPDTFRKADELFEGYVQELALLATEFTHVRDAYSSNDWIKGLFEHHFKVQKNKPPNGKASWILEHSRNNYILNTSMAFSGNLNDEYVHQYRSYTLQSFLIDLGKMSK